MDLLLLPTHALQPVTVERPVRFNSSCMDLLCCVFKIVLSPAWALQLYFIFFLSIVVSSISVYFHFPVLTLVLLFLVCFQTIVSYPPGPQQQVLYHGSGNGLGCGLQTHSWKGKYQRDPKSPPWDAFCSQGWTRLVQMCNKTFSKAEKGGCV